MNDDDLKQAKREYFKRWQKAHPQRVREYQKKWRDAHPESVRVYRKRYYEANKDKIITYEKTYRIANRNRILVRDSDRIAEQIALSTELYETAMTDVHALERYEQETANEIASRYYNKHNY